MKLVTLRSKNPAILTETESIAYRESLKPSLAEMIGKPLSIKQIVGEEATREDVGEIKAAFFGDDNSIIVKIAMSIEEYEYFESVMETRQSMSIEGRGYIN